MPKISHSHTRISYFYPFMVGLVETWLTFSVDSFFSKNKRRADAYSVIVKYSLLCDFLVTTFSIPNLKKGTWYRSNVFRFWRLDVLADSSKKRGTIAPCQNGAYTMHLNLLEVRPELTQIDRDQLMSRGDKILESYLKKFGLWQVIT